MFEQECGICHSITYGNCGECWIPICEDCLFIHTCIPEAKIVKQQKREKKEQYQKRNQSFFINNANIGEKMPTSYELTPEIRKSLDKRKKEGTFEELFEPRQLEIMNLVKEFLDEQKQEEIKQFFKLSRKR